MFTYTPNTKEMIMLAGAQEGSNCLGSFYPQYDLNNFRNLGKIWHYNVANKTWHPSTASPAGWTKYGTATEYDPISGKIILIDRLSMHTYDPKTEIVTKHIDHIRPELWYGMDLVYYPPNQKMYYIINNGTVFEVNLDRTDFSKSTITEMTDITGSRPLGQLPNIDDLDATGWAYDSVNHII